MAISVTVRGTPLHSTSNITAYTMTDAGTPTTGRLLLAFVNGRGADATFPSSFTGYGLTWTKVGEQGHGAAYSQQIWAVNSTGADSTDPVATWAVGRTGCAIQVLEIDGADLAGALLGGTIRDQGAGVYVALATAGTGTSITATLIAAGHANNRPFASFDHGIQEATTVRTNWANLDDQGFTSPANQAAAHWRSDAFDTSAVGAWATSGRMGVLAVEVIAGSGGVTGSGGVVATAVSLSGAGTETFAASGGVAASVAAFSGAGTETISGTGALAAVAASFAGSGTETISGTGAFGAAAAVLAGTGEVLDSITGTGGITVAAASLSGLGAETFEGTGALAASPAALSATGTETLAGTGDFAASPASLSGEGTETIVGLGEFSAAPASLSGTGAVGDDPVPISGTGAFEALAAQFSGTGAVQVAEVVVTGGGGFSQPWRPTPKKVKKIKGRGAFVAAPPSFSGFGDVEDVIAREDEELLLLV